MAIKTVHIVGGGLAGLSAGVEAVKRGIRPIIYEAAGRAGGRCRSFHDASLGLTIDNGNHLLLSGNHGALSYAETIGARDQFVSPEGTRIPFFNSKTGARWGIEPGKSRIPFWLFDANKRVPQTKPGDYLEGLGFLKAKPCATCADIVDQNGPLYRDFWEPLILAAINCDADKAAAQLMKPVLLETFARGAAGCRPMIARESLADALVTPAERYIEAHGGVINLGARLQAVDHADGRLTGLRFAREGVTLDADESAILALPSWLVPTFLPGLETPPEGEPIVNVHFRLEDAPDLEVSMVGIIEGFAHWVFTRPGLASVTISGAVDEATMSADDVAEQSWHDVRTALGLPEHPEGVPPYRVIKEKRATFRQDPESIRLRKGPQSPFSNLALAGDWTATGLPATIESAVRSGKAATSHLL